MGGSGGEQRQGPLGENRRTSLHRTARSGSDDGSATVFSAPVCGECFPSPTGRSLEWFRVYLLINSAKTGIVLYKYIKVKKVYRYVGR